MKSQTSVPGSCSQPCVYAAIVVRIMNRWVDRGLLDPDQTVYLDPIAPVLRPLLEA